MRRSTSTAALTLLLVPALGWPTVTHAAATPAAIAPASPPGPAQQAAGRPASVTTIPLGGTGARIATRSRTALASPDAGGPAVATAPRATGRFDLVAVTWTGRPSAVGEVEVRVREAGGWSDWRHLHADQDGPDPGTAESGAAAARSATAPLLTTGADGVQVRVDTPTGRAPAELALQLVDAGTTGAAGGRVAAAAPAPATLAGSAVPLAGRAPRVVTRAQWGANESLTRGTGVSSGVRALFVHHTDTTNGYTRAQAAAQVRAVHAFHTRIRGWNDVGYNFLVDRFGTIYEGRRGSLTDAVRGAHAGGFNTDTLGISMLGSFTSGRPPAATVRAVRDLVVWKSGQYFIDPRTSTVLTSLGGGTARYKAGVRVRVNTLSGHRDVGQTECPGTDGYPILPSVRRAAAARMVPGLTGTVLSTTATTVDGAPVTVTGDVPTIQRWTLTATAMCARTPTRTVLGTASTTITATWDLRDDRGAPTRPGVYLLTLSTRSPIGSVKEWSRYVEVLPATTLPPATPADPAPPATVPPTVPPAVPPVPTPPAAGVSLDAAACPVRRAPAAGTGAASLALGRSSAPVSASAVLVSGAAVDDQVVAAPLARAQRAPLLLTGADALPGSVAAELRRRRVDTVWVVGAPTAVQDVVLRQVRAVGVATVTRLAGPDRVGTAAAVAAQVVAVGALGGRPAPGAVLLNGDTAELARDPLAAVTASAAAALDGRPVLWAGARSIPPATRQALLGLGLRDATLAGSARILQPPVAAALTAAGITVRRITGPDAATVAVRLVDAVPGAGGMPDVYVVPAGRASVRDGIAAASTGRPLLTIARTGIPAPTAAWLRSHRPSTVTVVASTQLVGSSMLRALQAGLR